MKIGIFCSKYFYDRIPEIKEKLEQQGHEITLPNSYEDPFKEQEIKKLSKEEHIKWKANMIRAHDPTIRNVEAILILNFEKNNQPNYIGGATFLEIYKAFELEKPIFLMNSIPKNIFEDEIVGMNPTIINGDLNKIK